MDTGIAGTGADFHTGTGHFIKIDTIPIQVSDTSENSVRHQYRFRTLR